MKTKNIPAETIKRIEGLEKKKAEELEAINKQIRDNKAALAAAKDEVQNATERTDLKAYQDAKKKEADAAEAIEMYSARYGQIQRREYVTTKDSNATIDALIQYEKDIAEEYIKAIAGPIEELRKAHADYMNCVRSAENTIIAWTSRIHANYRSSTTTYADGTNISPTPVPVRHTAYTGSQEAATVGRFLEKININIAE